MRYTNDSWDEYIYLIETDGTGLRKLTRDTNVRESFPQFSPDGKLIIFSRWQRDKFPGIWIMNVDGTGRTALVSDVWADMPAWSPDGKSIAFMATQDNQQEIFIMVSDGSNRKRLTSDPSMDTLPVWSPDGKQIAFLSDRGGLYRWWVMNTDGSNQHLLADIKVYDTDMGVPYILLRGTWSRFFLEGTFFAPLITKAEQSVISIDVAKGTRGSMTFGDSLNIIEVYGVSKDDTSFIIATTYSSKSNSFDIVDMFSGGKSVTSSPEYDFASSSVFLKGLSSPSPTTSPTATGTGRVPGATIADLVLQKDVFNTIMLFEKIYSASCTQQKVTNTEVTQPLTVTGEWAERWTLDRCGVTVSYAVKFALDPKGGTSINVSLIKAQ